MTGVNLMISHIAMLLRLSEMYTCLTYSRCLIDSCSYYKGNRADFMNDLGLHTLEPSCC